MASRFDQIKKAREAKKLLESEVVEVTVDGVRVKVRADFKVLLVEVDGEKNDRLRKAFNKALKELVKVQVKKMKGMAGDFGF